MGRDQTIHRPTAATATLLEKRVVSSHNLPASRSEDLPPRMKNPALPGGGSLQFKLRLTRLLLALVLDIVPNRGLVDPHRGGEKSSCPNPATIPLHVAQYVREFLFQLPTRDTLQRLHHL